MMPHSLFVLIVAVGALRTYSHGEILSADEFDGEPLTLVEVRSTSFVISWAKAGNWAEVDHFTVEITGDWPDVGQYNCTCDNVTCSSDLCIFDSRDECVSFGYCSTLDITVEGNGSSSTIANVTSAPPAPASVSVSLMSTNITCSWTTSIDGEEYHNGDDALWCHTSTAVRIKTPAQEYSEEITEEEEEKGTEGGEEGGHSLVLELNACDVGEVWCYVAFRGGTNGTSEEESDSLQFTDDDAGSLISELDIMALPESLELSWRLTVNCSRLRGYQIDWTDDEAIQNETFLDSAVLSYDITGLVPCVRYTVGVEPLMEKNTSLALPFLREETTSIKAPGHPDQLTCEAATSGYAFRVSWQPPPKNNCSRSYFGNYTGDILWSGELRQSSFSTDFLFQDLEHLIPWTTYIVCIVGVTEDGQKGKMECCSTTTAQEAPGVPASFVLSDLDSHSVKLSWDPPFEQNGILSSYNLVWGYTNEQNYSANQTQTVITGLHSKTLYNFTIRARTEGGKYGEGKSLVVTTSLDVVPIILGVIGGVLLTVAAAIVYTYRRRILTFRNKMAHPRSAQSTMGNTNSNNSEDGLGMSTRYSYSGTNANSQPTDLKIEDLNQYIVDLELDSQKGLEEEFKMLRCMSSSHSASVSKKEFNIPKNRYTDVLPYDHTRVVLSEKEGVAGSDYINANYIKDINGEKTFIASQGPKEKTLDDFWRMIWEMGCPCVVMLTNLTERGKEKCFKYWPDIEEGSLQLSDITIYNRSEDHQSFYIVRHLEIEMGQKDVKMIKQYHFTAWPDFGAPNHVDQLLDFMTAVRSQKEITYGPVVVHCSAGVGRTGTFIGVWNLVDYINQKPTRSKIDIKGTVLAMRKCRPSMVQSQDQYLYLCKCIAAYIEQPHRWNMARFKDGAYVYDNDGFEED